MSQENVEIVRRAFEAWNEGDPARALEEVADDMVVDFSNSIGPPRGVYRGKEEALALFTELFEDFDNVRWDPEEIIDVDESTVVVVSHVRARGRGSGVPVDTRTAQVWHFSGGMGRGLTLYQSKAEALEAAGLSQ
jgi:ketosteroid isomerase-like protein